MDSLNLKFNTTYVCADKYSYWSVTLMVSCTIHNFKSSHQHASVDVL
jgi:hypothetical protein